MSADMRLECRKCKRTSTVKEISDGVKVEEGKVRQLVCPHCGHPEFVEPYQ